MKSSKIGVMLWYCKNPDAVQGNVWEALFLKSWAQFVEILDLSVGFASSLKGSSKHRCDNIEDANQNYFPIQDSWVLLSYAQ